MFEKIKKTMSEEWVSQYLSFLFLWLAALSLLIILIFNPEIEEPQAVSTLNVTMPKEDVVMSSKKTELELEAEAQERANQARALEKETKEKEFTEEIKEKLEDTVIEDSVREDYKQITSVLPKWKVRGDCKSTYVNVESEISLFDEWYDVGYYYTCKISENWRFIYEAWMQCVWSYDKSIKLISKLDCTPYWSSL